MFLAPSPNYRKMKVLKGSSGCIEMQLFGRPVQTGPRHSSSPRAKKAVRPPPPNSLPPRPTLTASAAGNGATAANSKAGKKRRPGPEEILAHYESEGLQTRDAAIKAIGELQALLYKSLVSGGGKKDRFVTDSLRKLDNANIRLAILEMKLDSKPSFGQSLAIGVGSGAFLQVIGAAIPGVLGGLRGVWDAVRATAKSTQSSA